MNPVSKFIMVAIGLCLLTSCSSAPRQGDNDQFVMLTPMLPPVKDPTTAQMESAITRFLQSSDSPAFAKYQFYRYDLDGDGRRDAIVLLQNPYKYWCNIHGCTLIVLKASDNDFRLVSKTQPIRAPFYISPSKTNGWHDLVVRVSGRWNQTKNVAMKFDGRQYPYSPESLPAYAGVNPNSAATIFR